MAVLILQCLQLLDCVSSLRKQVLLTLSSEDLAGDLESLAIISNVQGVSREGGGGGELSAVPPQVNRPAMQMRSTVAQETTTKASVPSAADGSTTQVSCSHVHGRQSTCPKIHTFLCVLSNLVLYRQFILLQLYICHSRRG